MGVMQRGVRCAAAVVLGAGSSLVLSIASVEASVAAADGSVVVVFGNPAVPTQPPSELPDTGQSLPAVPAGTATETHVYLNAVAGAVTRYGVLRASAGAGRIIGVRVRLVEDAADPQAANASTASLSACPLLEAPDKSQPDADVPYDCTTAVAGRRDSGGVWTFDLGSEAASVDPSSIDLAIVPVPAEGATWSVPVLRSNPTVTYEVAPAAPVVSTVDVTTRPAPPATGAIAPVAPDPLISSSHGQQPLGSGPGPAVAGIATTVSLAGRAVGTDSGRAPLLLLVPLVPFLVLALRGRWRAGATDQELYPGLTPV